MSKQISEKLLKKINDLIMENAGKQRQDFSDENRMLTVYVADPSMQPRICANKFNDRYCSLSNGIQMTGDNVIESFRKMGLGKIKSREEIFKDSTEAAKIIITALQENTAKDVNQKINDLIYKGHKQKKRIALIAMFAIDPQLGKLGCREAVLKLNKAFAGDCIDAIISLLNDDSNKKISNIKPEEYEAEIIKLHNEINRANRIIENLQNDFDEELEESKIHEQIAFITKLNSYQYGYILDMLTSAQKGLKKLRREKVALPIEISSVPVLIRRIIQFVEDCGIEEIADIGEELDITSSDLCNYDYDGTPFKDDNDIKHVVVISSGWKMYDKDIILSNPKVKEKED